MKALTYRRVIRENNQRHDPPFDSILHIDLKRLNNLIESDHAAMKRLLSCRQGFRSLRSAEATLSGVKVMRSIKKGSIHRKRAGISCEMQFIDGLFLTATRHPAPGRGAIEEDAAETSARVG